MLRVLLALEDYTELLYLQTLLRKIGLDVDGVQNERAFEDVRLGLNPDVILISARGRKLDGIQMASKLQKVRGAPKVALLFASQREAGDYSLTSGVNAYLTGPVDPQKVLSLLAELGNIDGETLLEKYRKIKRTLSFEENEILEQDEILEESSIQNTGVSSGSFEGGKKLEYKKFLDQAGRPTGSGGWKRSDVVTFSKEIRKEESRTSTEDLETERQAFVKALFNKN
ncbi:MAG: hypothetical protein KDD22_07740 [Bdellovibrionales bacterium]|nr:hypothetical protein [Bdellovibrionales bacterium]